MIFQFQNKFGEIIDKSFPIGKCPKYIVLKGKRFNRIFTNPYVIMDWKSPKTVDDLARKNTEKMEKDGTLPSTPKKKNPWWRPDKNKIDKDLAKMSPSKLQKYIETGKK